MERTTVKVMWDDDAYPPWITAGPCVDPVPVSKSLERDLQEWSDAFTHLMWGTNGPDRRPGSTKAEIQLMDQRGLELARRVRAELDDRWTVAFFVEEDDSLTEVVEPPRLVHRHHHRR